jgi:hypothetical protein
MGAKQRHHIGNPSTEIAVGRLEHRRHCRITGIGGVRRTSAGVNSCPAATSVAK